MKQPLRVEVAGEPLRCNHCSADVFFLESAAIDRLGLGDRAQLEEWWGDRAIIYVCAACGFVHWFFEVEAGRHERTEVGAMDEEIEGWAASEAAAPAEFGGMDEDIEGWASSGAAAEPVDCLACGQRIPAGESACPNCGWTWLADR
jgi:predicted RNA-binding Zn-ribbon protein involved in translation (DUF1610 family)